jgi:hypothetical protein
MAFGQDFLKAFFGNDFLKDYRHASKTFRTNGYENSPRFKFLFHVYFNLNTTQIPQLSKTFDAGEQSTIGLLVKNVELPKYRLDVETLNQYNRKRLVQKKIEYQPIRVNFHDDGGDLIRQLWYNYFSYYYKDPSQAYGNQQATNGTSGQNMVTPTGFDYNNRDIYDETRPVADWGYIGESYQDGTTAAGGKPAFFRDIQIYGFNQHRYVNYTLINPMISEWNHDTYDYAEGDGVMENSVTINYETVKYYTGGIGGVRPDTNVQGFGDPANYDTEPSPLSRPGGTRSILGQGGLLDAGIGIFSDLSSGGPMGVIGAVQTAGRAYGTFRGTNIGQVFGQEVRSGAIDIIRSGTLQPTAQPNGRARSPLQSPVFLIPPKPGNGRS